MNKKNLLLIIALLMGGASTSVDAKASFNFGNNKSTWATGLGLGGVTLAALSAAHPKVRASLTRLAKQGPRNFFRTARANGGLTRSDVAALALLGVGSAGLISTGAGLATGLESTATRDARLKNALLKEEENVRAERAENARAEAMHRLTEIQEDQYNAIHEAAKAAAGKAKTISEETRAATIAKIEENIAAARVNARDKAREDAIKTVKAKKAKRIFSEWRTNARAAKDATFFRDAEATAAAVETAANEAETAYFLGVKGDA